MSRASSIDLTTTKKELFSSVEDGIYVLGKPHRPSIPSLVSDDDELMLNVLRCHLTY